MTEKEHRARLKAIAKALKIFPKIVKQDEERGREHRKRMKAFEPMARDLARRVKAQREGK